MTHDAWAARPITDENNELTRQRDALLAALREARKWLRCRSVACGTDGWQCKVCATKAIADAALKEFGQQSQIDEYADRIVSLESQVATLTRERDEARRQRDDWQSMVVVRNRNLDTYVEQLKRENQMSGGIFDVFERWRELNDKLDRLRAENAELRRVLEAVEWHGYPTLKVKHWCPSCCVGHPKYKHLADCALGRALGRPECGEGT